MTPDECLAEIIRAGYLEDRLEYDAEMLARMYSLSAADAAELYRLIQEAP